MLLSLRIRPGTHTPHTATQTHRAEEEKDQLCFSVSFLGQNEPQSVLSTHFKLNQQGLGAVGVLHP